VLEDYPLAELVDYIDWTPFFSTWELTGKFPRSSTTQIRRGRALALRRRAGDAEEDRRRKAGSGRGRVGFWPANADGDDILV
jgi:5-methyltetrahydrofolate--homocysteine methyltransferase